MLRNLTWLLSAFLFLVVPAVARAEEPTKSYPDCGREPTEAEVAAAKGAFQAGNASFNEADYARAIDYWEDAYRRDCTANPLLLNLARAYELAGRKRQAVVALETFLAREPGTGEKEQISRRIEVLKKKIAEEDAAAAAPPPPSAAPAPLPGPVPPSGNAPPEHRLRRSPWPWVVMGVGAVVTTVGTLGVIRDKKKVDDAEAACGGARECRAPAGTPAKDQEAVKAALVKDGNDARAALTRSTIFLGAGVAMIAGGAVWWFLDKRHVEDESRSSGAQLFPLLGPELAGVGLTGAF